MNLLASEKINGISKALLKAQQNMGDATKDSTNPYFKSSYADLNAVREVAIPALNEQGITVLQPTISHDGKNFVRTLLLHESGEYLASDTEIVQAKPNDPQAHGSGISYARRYGLQSFLNIGAVDDDAEGAMDRLPKTTTKAVPTNTNKKGLVATKMRVLIASKKVNKDTLLAELSSKFNIETEGTADDVAARVLDKDVEAVLKYLNNLEK